MTLIPGDGVGPAVTWAARRALEATGVAFSWDVHEAGSVAVAHQGTPLPPDLLASVRRTRVALKGPLETPADGELRSVNVALRIELGLFAGVRPCRSYPGVRARYRDVDIVVIRENTEGMYTGIEFEMGGPGTAELVDLVAATTGKRIRHDAGVSVKAISEHASERIARFAFAHATAGSPRKVTVGHKANIMKFSDGLFLETCRRVAAGHPEISFEERIIDALTMQLVQRPQSFDVLVLPNLYGDLVSELCAGLVGGPGVVPAVDLGDEIAVFGSLHGSAPTHAGTDRADPTAMLLAGALLLRHLGETGAAVRLERAVAEVIAQARAVTFDLRPAGDPSAVGTTAMTDAVIARLADRPDPPGGGRAGR